jgi:hypothetical protein
MLKKKGLNKLNKLLSILIIIRCAATSLTFHVTGKTIILEEY